MAECQISNDIHSTLRQSANVNVTLKHNKSKKPWNPFSWLSQVAKNRKLIEKWVLLLSHVSLEGLQLNALPVIREDLQLFAFRPQNRQLPLRRADVNTDAQLSASVWNWFGTRKKWEKVSWVWMSDAARQSRALCVSENRSDHVWSRS